MYAVFLVLDVVTLNTNFVSYDKKSIWNNYDKKSKWNNSSLQVIMERTPKLSSISKECLTAVVPNIRKAIKIVIYLRQNHFSASIFTHMGKLTSTCYADDSFIVQVGYDACGHIRPWLRKKLLVSISASIVLKINWMVIFASLGLTKIKRVIWTLSSLPPWLWTEPYSLASLHRGNMWCCLQVSPHAPS